MPRKPLQLSDRDDPVSPTVPALQLELHHLALRGVDLDRRCAAVEDVDRVGVAVLPRAHAQQEADSVRLLLAPDLLQVLEGALREKRGGGEFGK